MHTLILLAALTSQIGFDAHQQGDTWTVIPQVTLTQDCQCRVQMETSRHGAAGNSTTRQNSWVNIRAGEPYALSQISFSAGQGDEVVVTVTITDGQALHLSRQWSPPGRV
ncbi:MULTISPECIES: curli assembly chaperone CsgC [Franconibacter]|uniref:Curli assembly protein CsgC n=1 Tax=Franconibacter daqui TaxID=2047724 RepID=A0ABV1PID5_9ENTR|nr:MULTISPECIES: curli assembly chaperone CsgC [Franconibacter]MEB5921034.1 curli assembly protein CsgC [Franconibacter daqui]